MVCDDVLTVRPMAAPSPLADAALKLEAKVIAAEAAPSAALVAPPARLSVCAKNILESPMSSGTVAFWVDLSLPVRLVTLPISGHSRQMRS